MSLSMFTPLVLALGVILYIVRNPKSQITVIIRSILTEIIVLLRPHPHPPVLPESPESISEPLETLRQLKKEEEQDLLEIIKCVPKRNRYGEKTHHRRELRLRLRFAVHAESLEDYINEMTEVRIRAQRRIKKDKRSRKISKKIVSRRSARAYYRKRFKLPPRGELPSRRTDENP